MAFGLAGLSLAVAGTAYPSLLVGIKQGSAILVGHERERAGAVSGAPVDRGAVNAVADSPIAATHACRQTLPRTLIRSYPA